MPTGLEFPGKVPFAIRAGPGGDEPVFRGAGDVAHGDRNLPISATAGEGVVGFMGGPADAA